jgi:putative sigma-54 modulation protein
MKITIQAIHFNADENLLVFVQKKTEKLEQYFGQIIDTEVYLKLEKGDIENKVAEIKIHLPGTSLFAKAQCKTFEEAIDLNVESLVRQLDKHKSKLAEQVNSLS